MDLLFHFFWQLFLQKLTPHSSSPLYIARIAVPVSAQNSDTVLFLKTCLAEWTYILPAVV